MRVPKLNPARLYVSRFTFCILFRRGMWVNDLTGFVIVKRMRFNLKVMKRDTADGLRVMPVLGREVECVGDEVDDLLVADMCRRDSRVFGKGVAGACNSSIIGWFISLDHKIKSVVGDEHVTRYALTHRPQPNCYSTP